MRLINIISLVLAAAVFLCSCQSSKTKDVNGIYRISEPLSAAADGKTISFSEYGGTIYYTTHSSSGGQIFSMNLAGENAAVFPAEKDAGAFYTLYESVYADDAGCLWYVERSYLGENFKDMTGAACVLHKARTDGAELLSVDLTEIISAFPDSADDIANLTVFNGAAFMSWGNRLIAVKDGKASFAAADGGVHIELIYVSGEGRLCAAYIPQTGGYYGGRIDTDNLTIEESTRLPDGLPYFCVADGNTDYDFIYAAEDGIYGAEKSGESRLICDYSASDISSEEYSFTRIKLLDDGRIVALSRGNSSPNGVIYLLTPVPPDDISLKTALTLGVWSPGEELRGAVAAFNKENKVGARIEIKDYSQYDTPSDRLGGITRLNADIVTDNAPDIINISQAMPYYSYCSKGLFADLGEYFGKDGIIPDDYFGNILDFSKVGGKQYSTITQFSFFTFAAKESLVNENLGKTDRFTAGDYLDLVAAHPGKAVFSDINRKQFVIYFENYMSAKFIDKETNEPKFGAEFADMLDFIMLLPEKSPYDLQNAVSDIASREEVRLMIQNDETLLSAVIISSFESYWKTKAGDFSGDMALLGTPGGDGSAILLVQNELAISSGSAHKAECAEFIKFCLSRKRQENITGGFPVNIDAFNAVMKKAYKARGVDAASTYVVPGGNPVNIGHISRDEAEYLKEYIEGITSVSRPDLTIQQIIGEELSRLISGGQTKEECTENIQNRAALYLSEQEG